MKNTKVAVICLSSQQSAWTDHFATIVDGLNKYGVITEAYTSHQGKKSFEALSPPLNSNIYCYEYSKTSIKRSIINILKISNSINKGNVDVVLVYGESPQHFLAALLLRKPIISHIADPIAHSGVGLTTKILFRLTKAYYLLFTSYIFVASSDVRMQVLNSFPIICFFKSIRKKIVEIRFAELSQFSKISKVILKRTPELKYDFVFFGRCEPYKGIDILLEAVNRLFSNGHRLKILIISKNFSYDTNDTISVVKDYLSNEDLGELIASSRWSIFPYLTATGTHTIHVSNNFGVPVIASKVGCFKDYIFHGTNGVLIDPNSVDALYEAMLHALNGDISTLRSLELSNWSNNYFSNNFATKQLIEVIKRIIKL